MRRALLVTLALATGCSQSSKPERRRRPGSAQGGLLGRDAAGELDGGRPRRARHRDSRRRAPAGRPRLIAATVYKLPNIESRKLGYIRLGGKVARDEKPVEGKGCSGDWYRIYPMGFVCTEQVTTDLDKPIVRAASQRPALDRALPYQYGFVRATAPQYLRIPTKAEQIKSEFQLEEHLKTFTEKAAEWQAVVLGANDVPLDDRGLPSPKLKHPEGFRPSTERTLNELFRRRSERVEDPLVASRRPRHPQRLRLRGARVRRVRRPRAAQDRPVLRRRVHHRGRRHAEALRSHRRHAPRADDEGEAGHRQPLSRRARVRAHALSVRVRGSRARARRTS